ncbi:MULTISPECIES: hypothetical protein [Halopseudomonas]|jgi:hypothetical protein|uniref:hypothetical protein n=1 Tax=Halopseudomonas TaxID=2901189 RepID=UPI001D18C53E|nr:hypothetical protein [Halopseudomonas aestusnigri]MCC4261801.1 hypothetical protein [Halopseudomonas aestusnigri]MCK5531778.1 hypothetical protein [Halopseudomonas aestusnigri]
MDRFALPPLPRVLNSILMLIQRATTLLALAMTFIYPAAAIVFVISAALTVGLWFKHPFTYAAVMVASFISITASLKTGDIVLACSSVLNALMALYIRLNLYELKGPAEPDAETE